MVFVLLSMVRGLCGSESDLSGLSRDGLVCVKAAASFFL